MSFLKSRKFWYSVAAAVLAGLKSAFPGLPLPDPSQIVTLGSVLVAGHAVTDAAHKINNGS